MQYKDRLDAGRQLARKLQHYHQHPRAIVLALPRGGVPVAYSICQILKLPLDIYLVRKIGVPGQEETAMGALAAGGVRVVNDGIISRLGISEHAYAAAAAAEQRELERRESLYRGNRNLPDLADRIVILVDDGMATGASMVAAVRAVAAYHPERIVVAVPIASPEAFDLIRQEAHECICPLIPSAFEAVGQWYGDFSQTSDDQVRDYLQRAVN